MINILSAIKKFYSKWNIQGFILLSLLLQTVLILFAPFRKRSRNPIIVLLIWSAYLLADWVANFAVGLISRHQDCYPKPNEDRVDILAFWATFLLLHLGGPDTISAFAMEDNALWLRHLVGLITQVLTALIVFGQSLSRNELWISTILLFVAGTIKYGERTYALYSANLKTFQESVLKDPNPGPDYQKLIKEYAMKNEGNDIVILEPNEDWGAPSYEREELGDVKMVKYAYHFFEMFKGLIADAIFSVSEREESQLFFDARKHEDAFGVLAIELNFIYEVFYTKVVMVYSKLGCVVRFISLCAVVAALSTFHSINKHDFRKIDVQITYTLLFGAISLDAIALLSLATSDRTVAYIEKFSEGSNWMATVCKCLLFFNGYFLTLKRINWATVARSEGNTSGHGISVLACINWIRKFLFARSASNTSGHGVSMLGCINWIRKFLFWCIDYARGMLFRRWSESLHTLNLVDYCLKECPKTKLTTRDHFVKLLSVIGCPKDLCDWIKHVSKKPVEKELWEFIFTELKKKSKEAYDPEVGMRRHLSQGGLILQDNKLNNPNSMSMSYAGGVNYDQDLLMWHIATDLCLEKDGVNESDTHLCEISKILSNYMLYLLVMQPTFMSPVTGIGKIRFRDTCAEAKDFFSKFPERMSQQGHKWARKKILAANTDVEPVILKGDRSKSILFDACILAKKLQELDPHERWKLISDEWVKLLSYAAGHCRADMHVAQISKGGELITFVWLLMAHLGLGNNFQSYMGFGGSVAAKMSQPPIYFEWS